MALYNIYNNGGSTLLINNVQIVPADTGVVDITPAQAVAYANYGFIVTTYAGGQGVAPAQSVVETSVDGANVTVGSTTDAPWSGSGPATLVGVMKGLFTQGLGPVAVTGTFWPATQPVSATALPLPGGASTSALQTSGNVTLSSILTTLQTQRVESLWTDDTNAYFVRVDTNGAIAWNTIGGGATSAPGTGARPAAGTTAVVDKSSYQAVAVATGYAVGDLIDHIVTTDPVSGAILGQYWLNTTQGTALSSGPASANISPLSPLPIGAATSAAQTAQSSALAQLHTDLSAAATSALQTSGNATLAQLHADLTSTTATSALQGTGNTALTQIHTDLTTVTATSANQATQTTALGLLHTDLTTVSATSVLQTAGNATLAQLHADLTAATPAGTNVIGGVFGNVLGGVADSGAPVKVGGVYNASLPTYATGQRGDAQLSTRGELITALSYGGTPVVAGTPNLGAGAAVGLWANARPYLYNGASFDPAFSVSAANATTGTGVPASGMMGWDATNSLYRRVLADTTGNAQVNVQGRTSSIAVTPTVTSGSAYAVGNVVGGLLNFAGAVDGALSGDLLSVRLALRSVQTGAFQLYLFSANPTASTFADKSAPVIAAADVAKCIGCYPLSTPYSGLGTHTIYNADGVAAALGLTTSTLYGVLVTLNACTFGGTTDPTCTVGILKD